MAIGTGLRTGTKRLCTAVLATLRSTCIELDLDALSKWVTGTKAAAAGGSAMCDGPLASSGSDVTSADMRETSDKQVFDGLTLEFGLQVLSDAPLVSSDAPECGMTGTKADEGGTLIKIPGDAICRDEFGQGVGPQAGTTQPSSLCTAVLATESLVASDPSGTCNIKVSGQLDLRHEGRCPKAKRDGGPLASSGPSASSR